jgi:hypothetical protein
VDGYPQQEPLIPATLTGVHEIEIFLGEKDLERSPSQKALSSSLKKQISH